VISLAQIPTALTAAELARLRAVALRDAPAFADRLAGPIDVERIEQPWFRRHRILAVQSPAPFPARVIHVAASDSDLRVLTAHLEHFQQIAASDPPAGLADEYAAATYAAYGNAFTRSAPYGEMTIASWDEIPWQPGLDGVQNERVEDVHARWSPVIRAQTSRRDDDGWHFHSWWIAARRLIERELIVAPSGHLRRIDQVREEDLPVPLGRHWKFVKGRLVPVG
jgi:hypothetical protein